MWSTCTPLCSATGKAPVMIFRFDKVDHAVDVLQGQRLYTIIPADQLCGNGNRRFGIRKCLLNGRPFLIWKKQIACVGQG